MRQSETAVGDDDESAANHCHKQSGYQRDDVGFLAQCEVNGCRPKRYHGQQLVGPSEITPDGLETVGIHESVNEYGAG